MKYKKYLKLTQIKHILKRPGMYIGSIENKNEMMWILKNNKILEKNKLFAWIIQNI